MRVVRERNAGNGDTGDTLKRSAIRSVPRGRSGKVREARATILAPAKINLGLEVLSRRADGYHEILTILQAIQVSDRVDLTVRTDREASCVSLAVRVPQPGRNTSRNEALPSSVAAQVDLGPEERNLAVRAAESYLLALGTDSRSRTATISITLHKRIPVGAGLGGGSSDAAAVLVGLARLLPGKVDLAGVGATLGSDVPFFLEGGTQLGSGRGEVVRPVRPWPRRPLVVIHPTVTLATSSVYSGLTIALTPQGPLARMAGREIGSDFWKTEGQRLQNDLEQTVVAREPVVGAILEELHALGSPFARVTGSGSGVFAVCSNDRIAAEWAERFRRYGYWARAVRPSRVGCRIL